MSSLSKPLTLEIANEARVPLSYRPFRGVVVRAGRVLRLPQCSHVQLVLMADRRMRGLNLRTRRINRPTDVLSFPLHARNDIQRHPRDADRVFHLGDIVISLDTARRAARAEKKSLSRELAELFAHGLLHLAGYDHHTSQDARRMEQLAARLLWRNARTP